MCITVFLKRLNICLPFLLAILGMGADGHHMRVDPLLGLVSRSTEDQRQSLAHCLRLVRTDSTEEAGVILDYEGDPSALRTAGLRMRSQLGSIRTGTIRLDKLDDISRLPGIKFIEIGKRLDPVIDVSVPETGATSLRSGVPPAWNGFTGKGVVIGFVDTGLDIAHEDFKDQFGKTRVLFIWDQTTGEGGINHPAGYDYGTEWTKAQIDAGLCTQIDTAGHGTGVASVAAGDGSATGNGWPAYRYVGMAPEADIIMVKSTFYTDTVVDALSYITAKATALGKPCVINLSIGTHFGAHDGTSLIEQAIEQISGPGVVVCTAAGNSGTTDPSKFVHAQWSTPTRNSSVTAGLNVSTNRSNPFYVDIWYKSNDSIDVTVTSPNGYSITKQTGSTTGGYVTTLDGGIWLDNSSGGTNPYNGDRECVVAIKDAVAGSWSVTATGRTIRAGGQCDAWIAGSNVYWLAYGTNAGSCTIPGTCNSAITAGGYLTKTRWYNPDGTPQGWDSTYGCFYSVSGEGPTRDGRQKPDLCAPAQVAVARSSNANLPAMNVVEDGVHIILGGTSFASPHASGAAALMLQKDPTATAEEIRMRLIETARSDDLTGTVPNTKWGFGKMAAASAFLLTPLYTNIAGARLQSSGSLVKLSGEVVTAGIDQLDDRFYVESQDRSAGIQVRISEGIQPTEGDKVTVVGTADIVDGERAIVNSAVTRIGTGTVPKPLSMNNRDVGGSDLSPLSGDTGGNGLNNVGLLVRIWGRVTYIGDDYFYIDDGSCVRTGPATGIKVICSGLAKPTATSQYAIVTGISCVEQDGDIRRPVLRPRKQADLLYY